MPEMSSALSEFFARHPSSIGASGVGGYYRVICQECGEIISVHIPDPHRRSMEVRCEHCGWAEHSGEPAPTGAADRRSALAL